MFDNLPDQSGPGWMLHHAECVERMRAMSLMQDIVRHVCPPGGLVLDPFAGTGTTLRAAVLENMRAIGIEADASSVVDSVWRMRHDMQN